MIRPRRLYKAGRWATSEAGELLQGLFVSELVAPSTRLWLVSPWITDFPTIDNRTLAFERLVPEWGPRVVHLTEVVRGILIRGGHVSIVTRPSHSDDFIARLGAMSEVDTTSGSLNVVTRTKLHEKGVLSDSFHLGGSMNLTYSGVQINDEALILDTDPDTLAHARSSYVSRYGAPEQVGSWPNVEPS